MIVELISIHLFLVYTSCLGISRARHGHDRTVKNITVITNSSEKRVTLIVAGKVAVPGS